MVKRTEISTGDVTYFVWTFRPSLMLVIESSEALKSRVTWDSDINLATQTGDNSQKIIDSVTENGYNYEIV